MKITDEMIERVRDNIDERVSSESVQRALEAFTSWPEVRAELLREIAAGIVAEPEDLRIEPTEIGTVVIDCDGDEWTLGARGWRFRGTGVPETWREVRRYAPLRLKS